MNGTATIVISIVGAAVGITGVLGLMLRILATNIAREFNSTNKRIDDPESGHEQPDRRPEGRHDRAD